MFERSPKVEFFSRSLGFYTFTPVWEGNNGQQIPSVALWHETMANKSCSWLLLTRQLLVFSRNCRSIYNQSAVLYRLNWWIYQIIDAQFLFSPGYFSTHGILSSVTLYLPRSIGAICIWTSNLFISFICVYAILNLLVVAIFVHLLIISPYSMHKI